MIQNVTDWAKGVMIKVWALIDSDYLWLKKIYQIHQKLNLRP